MDAQTAPVAGRAAETLPPRALPPEEVRRSDAVAEGEAHVLLPSVARVSNEATVPRAWQSGDRPGAGTRLLAQARAMGAATATHTLKVERVAVQTR